jgi:hypothetical protein
MEICPWPDKSIDYIKPILREALHLRFVFIPLGNDYDMSMKLAGRLSRGRTKRSPCRGHASAMKLIAAPFYWLRFRVDPLASWPVTMRSFRLGSLIGL